MKGPFYSPRPFIGEGLEVEGHETINRSIPSIRGIVGTTLGASVKVDLANCSLL
jgi:hypothetical protein